ncbi:MAG: DNA starvation/stationary phase protection protein [Bacteroidota bacterium]
MSNVKPTRPYLANGSGSTEKANMGRTPLRTVDAYEGNPIGLPDAACIELKGHLDRHLAAYNILYHQYHKHHWLVVGPQFRDLHLFLETHYNEAHAQLDEIAERLTVLGGIPTCSPSAQEKLAYIQHEPEGQFPVRDMLELDLLCEKQVCIELRKSIHVALNHSDFGTKRLLEKLLAHAEDRAHHLEHFLENDTLEVGLTATESDLAEDPVLEAAA